MNKKLLTILVSILFISIIPSVVGVNSELDKETCNDGASYRGLAFNLPNTEDDTYFVIWLRLDESQGDTKFIFLKWVTFHYGLDTGREFVGRFGILISISGFYREIEYNMNPPFEYYIPR